MLSEKAGALKAESAAVRTIRVQLCAVILQNAVKNQLHSKAILKLTSEHTQALQDALREGADIAAANYDRTLKAKEEEHASKLLVKEAKVAATIQASTSKNAAQIQYAVEKAKREGRLALEAQQEKSDSDTKAKRAERDSKWILCLIHFRNP